MQKTVAVIGPEHHGQRMSLAEFDTAEGREGRLYELSRGIITVTDVPDFPHLAQVDAAREQLSAYRRKFPGRIHTMAGGSDCKILLDDLESERHPDWVVYKTPPPSEGNLWASWVPEIVIEVVSPSSRHRDYDEKPDEYLQFGVREYWIIDRDREEMLVLRRSGGRWARRVVKSGERYRTRLLPEFEFDLAAVFEGARSGGRS
jgi:Uma2 family endonuclease